MNSNRNVRLVAALLPVFSTLAAFGADTKTAVPNFDRDVQPILKSHCVQCHGPKKQEGRVRLDNLSTDLINNRAAAETWHEVLNVLNRGEMPPEDEKQLSADQRKAFTGWVRAAIQQAVEVQRKTEGRVVMRRLNRVEYSNTMLDLLGLEMDYARDLPPDAISADGFRNNGRSLQMSAIQLEYYLDTARRALDRVIVSGPAPKVYEANFTKSNVRGWLGKVERSNRLGRRQVFLGTMPKEYPETGEFLIRATFTAELKENTGFPLLELSVGYRPDTKILFREAATVEITSPEEQTLEFRGRIENFPLPVRGQGKFPGLVVRFRNAYDDGSPFAKGNGKGDKKKGTVYPDEPNLPVINIKAVEFRGPVFDKWPPANHRRILFESELREANQSEYVAEVLNRFMRRAYRRPATDDEVRGMVEFFEQIAPEFPSFEDAMRETLAMVLIRPDFLYLMEPAFDQKRPITDWELASRLSYFLWSTMPDDRLMELADAKKLSEPKTLAAEVERLLTDERANHFVDQFTEQWLHLDTIDRVAVSKDYYPKFDERLKSDMRGETESFFAELLAHDLSTLNLIQSDFAMVNERLAKHYGIEGIFGREFRRVKLSPEMHRGGLLGHAGVLLANSTGEDSHAVRRAVWIRDRLLNDPPANPPPNVPSLNEADPKFAKLPIREQLKIHRNTESCASCHRGIDPWGIALENYDAVGLWRDEVRRKTGRKFESQPVNANDQLPNGTQFDGANSLRTYLVKERKDQFARSLVARLLTYALGRRLELSDNVTVDDITQRFAANDYRLRSLVKLVVASPAFQTK